MANSNTRASGRVFTVLGITALAIAATLMMVFVFTEPPRGFVPWAIACVLTLIEATACAFVLTGTTQAKSPLRLSSVVWIGLSVLLGFYAVVEILSIIVYSSMRDHTSNSDVRFLAVLILETVVFFIVGAALACYDKSERVAEQPALARREMDSDAASSIREALDALRRFNPTDSQVMRRAEILSKRLYGAQTALEHSHGGGLGSYEQPVSPESGDATRRETAELVAALCGESAGLASHAPSEAIRSLTAMEEHVVRLENIVRKLGLE